MRLRFRVRYAASGLRLLRALDFATFAAACAADDGAAVRFATTFTQGFISLLYVSLAAIRFILVVNRRCIEATAVIEGGLTWL